MSVCFRSLMVLAALAGPAGALAQSTQAPPATSPSQSTAQSEAGEPRAATSADEPRAAAMDGGAAPAAEAAPSAGAAGGRKSAHPSPRPAEAPAAGSGHAESRSAQDRKAGAADRLELGTATVTGDREQPKVMYIVPWKKSDIGDLSGKPMNSLLDEALAPIDRDEFKRQVMYYQVVKADASQNGASKAPPAQGEK